MKEEIQSILRSATERGLPSLLIGGNAVILFGYIRSTVDLDLLVPESSRSQWLDLFRDLGYRFFHGVSAFAQFEPPERRGTPVDLMFVDDATWGKLQIDSVQKSLAGQPVNLPRPDYLVALKLHAATSATRRHRERDWEDIYQLIRICRLNPDDDSFRTLILRYGGEDALRKIKEFDED
jgi:hypothetical protein